MTRIAARMVGLHAIALFAFASNGFAQSDVPSCFRYVPDTVRLTGTLERRTYAGAPNYESTESGDEPETGFYLIPDRPICTEGGGAAHDNEPHKGVRRVQLVVEPGALGSLASRVGKRVTLRGTLSSSSTGNHHAPILISALSPVEMVDDARRLLQIPKWFAATSHALPHDRVVNRDLSDFSTEGGELTAYFAAGTLQKLDVWRYGETGRAHEEFFLRDGEPIFVLVSNDRYDHTGKRRITNSYRTRLYFDHDRLLAWTDSTGRRSEVIGRAAEELARNELRSFEDLERCTLVASAEPCEAPPDSTSR